MASILDLLPVRSENVRTIRARIDADANAGLDPTDARWIDTAEGGFYWDLTQPFVLEASRLWDMLSIEVVAAMFPVFAWGEYLDDHGETIDLPRKDETFASGVVTFTGTVGTQIPTGTEVSTTSPDPDSDPVVFSTTGPATIPGGGSVDVAVQAEEAGVLGNVSSGQISILQSPVPGVSAVANAAATGGGADVETDDDYRIRILKKLSEAQGAGNAADYVRWALDYPGVGHATAEAVWDGPGTVRVIVTDEDNQPVGSPVVDGLQAELDPPITFTSVGAQTLPTSTFNVVTTSGAASPSGSFVVNGQRVDYTGLTGTSFTGCTGGTGSVSNGSTLKQYGKGAGKAPVGAWVTVATSTGTTVNVAATISYETGFSATGAGGTIAIGPAIEAAIASYIDNLAPGEDVVLNHVIARCFAVDGVFDVSGVTLNTVAANVSIAADHIATLGTITLS